jgi:ABC-type multidrug transport system ATPase subunit
MITHIMEESEALGDVIGIMIDGNLNVLGTSLNLKDKLGAAYCVIAATKSRHAAKHIAREIDVS